MFFVAFLINRTIFYTARLPQDISALEFSKLSCEQALDRFLDTGRAICALPGSFGSKLRVKLNDVLARYPGFNEVQVISENLSGLFTPLYQDRPLSPADISCFKHAPVTSCDVEGSFSLYKATLSDRRRNFF